MDFKQTPEQAALYRRFEEGMKTIVEKAPSEAFKWLGWASRHCSD